MALLTHIYYFYYYSHYIKYYSNYKLAIFHSHTNCYPASEMCVAGKWGGG